MAGAGMLLAGSNLFAAKPVSGARLQSMRPANIKTKGWAATNNTSPLSFWEFERRPVGDNDILIEIKFSGICHSDIHTVRGEWGPQQYPLVPGHEIAGIVTAVGKNVKKFRVGDQAGVGCMVDSCGTCTSCREGNEQFCDNPGSVMTYGTPDKRAPTGVTQGGYANNIVVTEKFAIKIPNGMALKDAAPLLCAGVTTYSPLLKNIHVGVGMKVGVAGIGGLGHMAVKLAHSLGAEVYAFTTSAAKVNDIKGFGAKEVIVVDSIDKLKPYMGQLDYMISTIPVKYDLGAYVSLVRPFGHYTQVGLPATELSFNNFAFIKNRVNFSGSLIGGIKETQDVLDYCAKNKIYPRVEVIEPAQINETYAKVLNKEARYRYVIDAARI